MKSIQSLFIGVITTIICLVIISCTPSFRGKQGLSDEEINKKFISLIKIGEQIDIKESPDLFFNYYDSCTEFFLETPIKLAKKNEVRFLLINKLRSVGIYEDGIRLAMQILKENEKFKDDSVTLNLNVYDKLSQMYSAIGEVDSAKHYQNLSILESRKHTENIYQASPLNNYGMTLYKMGYKDSAILCFQKADSFLVANRPLIQYWNFFQGCVRDNIATHQEFIGDYESTLTVYSSNYRFYKDNPRGHFRRVNAGISWANSLINLGKFDTAMILLKEVEIEDQQMKYEDQATNRIYLFETMAQYYEGVGDLENAVIHYQKAIELTKNLSNEKIATQSRFSKNLFKYAKKRLKDKLELERNLMKQTNRLKALIGLLLFLGLGSLLIFAYVRKRDVAKTFKERSLRVTKEKELLDLKLEFQNKDLLKMGLSLAERQEWAKMLNNQLKLIKESRGNKRAKEFKSLEQKVEGRMILNKEMSVFDKNMHILNSEYSLRIETQFPDLTKSEKQLFNFIKLMLDPTQIAQLKNVEPASIKVMRYRLKTKLNLGSDVSLDHFIHNF